MSRIADQLKDDAFFQSYIIYLTDFIPHFSKTRHIFLSDTFFRYALLNMLSL